MMISASKLRMVARSGDIHLVLSDKRTINSIRSKVTIGGPIHHVEGPQTHRKVVARASSSSSGPSEPADSHAGHAFLHDFCMSLPYAAISLVAAIVLIFLGSPQTAFPVAVGGLVVAISSAQSLKKWKADQTSSTLTLLIGGVSGYIGYTCWRYFQSGIVQWLTGSVTALSAAMALFAFYNVAAGGNPPKKK